MKWEFKLDRTPKGNVVQVRCGPLVVRIPQQVWQRGTDELFPPVSNGVPLSRWDVGTWEDLTSEQKDMAMDTHCDEWR